jgi:hypothetical protein
MLAFMSRPYNIVNWSFWVALVFVAGWVWFRSLRNRGGPGPLTATLVSLLSVVVVLVAVRLVYVAPWAIIQDLVAARQVLKGEPLPTTEIEPLVTEVLAAEQRPASLPSVWPWLTAAFTGLARQEQQEYDQIPHLIQVQAHPPFATLCAIPFVYFLGVHDSAIALSFLSLGCVAVSLLLICRGLRLNLSASQTVLFYAVFLGWYPMYGVLRSGQWGALLCLLVVAGWYGIRRDRPILGGVAIGVAVSLKLFPALMLLYFLLRHRRACWAGVATILILNTATMAVVGPQFYLDYLSTARSVVDTWGGDLDNCSLLGALHHLGDLLGIPALSSRAVFMATALLLVAVICLLVLAARPSVPRIDFEFSLFVVAMTFLSPTCWFHYFVVLLLPLTLLANQVRRERASASLLFLGLFLVLAMPHSYHKSVLPFVEPYLGPRAGVALVLLPSLALVGMIVWLAVLGEQASPSLDRFSSPV